MHQKTDYPPSLLVKQAGGILTRSYQLHDDAWDEISVFRQEEKAPSAFPETIIKAGEKIGLFFVFGGCIENDFSMHVY